MDTLFENHRSRSSERGLIPFRRTVAASVIVEVPTIDIRQVTRICLSRLVRDTFSSPNSSDPIAYVSMRRFSRLFRVPVEIDIQDAYGTDPGALAHIHWRARRYRRLFPVMEGHLVARPRVGGTSALLLEATYRPPLGILGLSVDLLLGRNVARATAEAFLSELGHSLEHALQEGDCAYRRCDRGLETVA